LPTLVSATPTMAYLPLMFDIKPSGYSCSTSPLPHRADISNL
jgi:hypothetical protein